MPFNVPDKLQICPFPLRERKRTGKEEYLYSAFYRLCISQSAQAWITQFYLQIHHACLSVPALAVGKGGILTSVGWLVKLCDPIWHVSFP